MINKFRYKKPPQGQQKNCNENEGKKCGDNSKDNGNNQDCANEKLNIKDNGTVLSSVLGVEVKKTVKELFSQLQFSPETALPPDALRRALAESFFDQQRFQLGFMDDAAECFENMLLRIHQHVAHSQAEDACAAPHCVPHQKFAMTLVEQAACGSCGATSEPLSYTQMVHYISTSTLVYQVRTNAGRANPLDSFGNLLQKAGSMGDIRQCPSACGSVIQIGRTLMNHPEIVSIGLVWNSERPTLEHITEVFSSIGTTVRLVDVFNTVVDSRWAETSMHNLVGVVTYYGKHYSTFFFHTKLRVWIYFDDATVREVGPRWEQVVEKCRKGRYQPLLLLYALPDGTPVNTENAPKQITPFFSEKNKKQAPNQPLLRRSVTPSPEKPMIGNTRRAITPNPDSSLNQKPPLPRSCNEYQNLSVIQRNIYLPQESQSFDKVDSCINNKEPEYVTRKSLDFGKPQVSVHRTLSSGSSSGVEGMCIPDHLNLPRRRDSGNWSGDRNSASSASSTTMENPYLYLVGKVPHGAGNGPGSPTRIKSDSSSGSSGVYDAGYDSYSLSSNDSSSMSTLQHLMKMGHLAKIPEDYSNVTANQTSLSCDVLCDEADELLVKSRQLEDEHDLVLALALCNAAATKARAAMNAPYNNPQTLTLARMKHNTCIMRARSLHRRMTQSQNIQGKDKSPEIRHTREGSSSSGRHSRQNSRDKGQHSRQSSRELLLQQEKENPKPTKSIEIYATLPKKKDALRAKMNTINIEDAEYMLFEKPPERESRSIFSRSKNKDAQKVKEKRSRSEDRNKLSRCDFSIAPEVVTGKDTLKKAKDVKEKEDKKDKDGKNKKQHKIRRKLLMGGLIKRKNRSMPDLTDANTEESSHTESQPSTTVDDSNVGLKGNCDAQQGMSGYLSEGHLEFAGTNTNPNLERSKLMRKSFHCSAGKILTAAKVPPPPPLRTTSQLSRSKLHVSEEVVEDGGERSQFPLPSGEMSHYHNCNPYNDNQSSISLPYYHNNSSYDDDSYLNASSHTVVTQADVHQEECTFKSPASSADSGVDEVDCLPSHSAPMLELPPYPSPAASTIHSRQASEEFPPPPPPLDLSALDEHLPKHPLSESPLFPEPDSLLAQLQSKRQQILSQENELQKSKRLPLLTVRSSGDTWLKELQAKQAALRIKKNETSETQINGIDEVNTQRYLPGEAKNKSVKDLASKFENTETNICGKPRSIVKSPEPTKNENTTLKRREDELSTIAPEQIAEEIREVEMLTSAVNKAFGGNWESTEDGKPKLAKKKSVSFCDQVILVATAEEQEDDSYIPNPILERVLRSAVNKPEAVAIRQEIMSLKEQNSGCQNPISSTPSGIDIVFPTLPCNDVEQPLYVRRNSIENVLNVQNSLENQEHLRQSISNQGNNYNGTPLTQTCQIQVNPNGSRLMLDQPYHNGYGSHILNTSGVPNSYQYSPYPQPNVQNNNYYTNQNNGTCQGPYVSTNPQYIRQGDIQQNMYKQTPAHVASHNYPGPTPQHSYNEQSPHHSNGQYGTVQKGHYIEPNTPYRQSPYQAIPQNSLVHPAYYSSNRVCNGQSVRNAPDYNCQTYSSSPRTPHNPPQIRQSTPSPMGFPNNQVFNHPPSPAPSLVSPNYNYHPSMYRGSPNNNNVNQSVYQRIPQLNDYPQNHTYGEPQQYQRVIVPERPDVYQRVPPPHCEQEVSQMNSHIAKYSPYQHIPAPKQILKKTVSFEPGTKGCDSPTPKAIVTPIIVNNANNSVPTDKTKCNLCRKKNVVASNLYCTDCEFYMSRFKPRT